MSERGGHRRLAGLAASAGRSSTVGATGCPTERRRGHLAGSGPASTVHRTSRPTPPPPTRTQRGRAVARTCQSPWDPLGCHPGPAGRPDDRCPRRRAPRGPPAPATQPPVRQREDLTIDGQRAARRRRGRTLRAAPPTAGNGAASRVTARHARALASPDPPAPSARRWIDGKPLEVLVARLGHGRSKPGPVTRPRRIGPAHRSWSSGTPHRAPVRRCSCLGVRVLQVG